MADDTESDAESDCESEERQVAPARRRAPSHCQRVSALIELGRHVVNKLERLTPAHSSSPLAIISCCTPRVACNKVIERTIYNPT